MGPSSAVVMASTTGNGYSTRALRHGLFGVRALNVLLARAK
jgi:hypothetical protein